MWGFGRSPNPHIYPFPLLEGSFFSALILLYQNNVSRFSAYHPMLKKLISLVAKPMSPAIFNLPDMKAAVAFRVPPIKST